MRRRLPAPLLVTAILTLAGGALAGEPRPEAPTGPPTESESAFTLERADAIVRPSNAGPAAVLLLTARSAGRIGPCGCLERPGGGLARRAGFEKLLQLVWPETSVAWISAGGFSGGPGREGRVRTRILAAEMARLGYRAVNVGPEELRAGLDAYSRDVRSADLPLLSSNLRPRLDPKAEGPLEASLGTRSQRVLDLGELRVGILGVAVPAEPLDGVEALDPVEALLPRAAELRGEVDFLLVLAVAPREAASRIAREVPGLDLVYAGWESVVTPHPIDVEGVPVLFGGDEGRWLTEARLHARDGDLLAVELVSHYLGEEVPEEPGWARRQRRILSVLGPDGDETAAPGAEGGSPPSAPPEAGSTPGS